MVQLPKIKHDKKLPVVPNHQECKALFSAPELLKHRVVLSFIYSAGLRACEASKMKLSDIDSGRMMIHIRQSKYNKDRYVPLSPLMLEGLRKYYYFCHPVNYLFNGHETGSPLSVEGIRSALRETVKNVIFRKGLRSIPCATAMPPTCLNLVWILLPLKNSWVMRELKPRWFTCMQQCLTEVTCSARLTGCTKKGEAPP